MKNITTTLRTHLQGGGPFTMADLYTITMASGAVLRWTDFDVDIVHPTSGQTHSSTGPVLKRGKTRLVIGVEVDSLDVNIYPTANDLINGVSLLSAAQAGAFDGAMLTLERAFLSPSPTAVGVVHLFYGRFADLQLGRTALQCRINSGTESFIVQLPRNVYQPGCVHTLFDSGCGLARTAFASTTSVASGSTAVLLNCSLGQAAGYFDRGYVMFVGGVLDGVRRTIKSHTAGVLNLFSPLPSVPTVGASFTAYPGCDKLQATCTSKFSNVINFRGAPYIPAPETAA
jgi:uncharacterized phage protein (TIGR02218 family)